MRRVWLSQEDTWASDPNAFVADEDDEMLTYNVRAASIDLTIVRDHSRSPDDAHR